MDIYIEKLITENSFLHFEIGSKINLSSFKVEEDYNVIGDNKSNYSFFDKEIDVEVTIKEGLVFSFDVVLRHQENDLYLGVEDINQFNLNKCNLDTFISFMNETKSKWRFESILNEKSISIVYYSKLTMLFYFDCESSTSLSLIHIFKPVTSGTTSTANSKKTLEKEVPYKE